MNIFIFVLFGLPGLTATIMGALDLKEERSFLANAKKTLGKIVGAVGAKYRSTNQYGVDLAGTATGGAMTQYVKGERLGGAFVIVEYEDKQGRTYRVRSRQTFNEVPESVTVHYNRQQPQKAVVNEHYNSNAKYYQIAGGVLLMLVPFIIYFFAVPA